MQRSPWKWVLAAAFVLPFLAAACQSPAPPPPPQPAFTPDATIREVMKSMVEPGANNLWDSVAITVSIEGTDVRAPQNDEEWEQVRHDAVMVAEATNLLLIPGRQVAPPGAVSADPGVELEPGEIQKLIDADPESWTMLAKGLHEAAMTTLHAIDAKDPEALSAAGEGLDTACENCHLKYWYPNRQ